MHRIVMSLAATVIWAAAASPSPASASTQDHVKAKHAKAMDAKRIQGVVKKAQRVVESKSEAPKPRAERKPKRVAKKTQRIVEKAHKHGIVQAEPAHRALHATAEAELDLPDTTNALVALAMRYDGKNPTGWSHNCALVTSTWSSRRLATRAAAIWRADMHPTASRPPRELARLP